MLHLNSSFFAQNRKGRTCLSTFKKESLVVVVKIFSYPCFTKVANMSHSILLWLSSGRFEASKPFGAFFREDVTCSPVKRLLNDEWMVRLLDAVFGATIDGMHVLVRTCDSHWRARNVFGSKGIFRWWSEGFGFEAYFLASKNIVEK